MRIPSKVINVNYGKRTDSATNFKKRYKQFFNRRKKEIHNSIVKR
jgi:hypothetical protein